MSSDTDIVNLALTRLGAARIISLDQATKEAREMKALYEMRRDALLRAHYWNFARKRVSLPALVDAPDWGYAYAYQLPSDFLAARQVGDYWLAPGLIDYLSGPDSELYKLETLGEQRVIATDIGPPLPLAYTFRVPSAAMFDPTFADVLACDLAFNACEAITQSNSKKESAREDLNRAMIAARRANAIELPPENIPDDSWILSRL